MKPAFLFGQKVRYFPGLHWKSKGWPHAGPFEATVFRCGPKRAEVQVILARRTTRRGNWCVDTRITTVDHSRLELAEAGKEA